MNLMEILSRGGWMMGPIYLCFLVSCALAMERIIMLRRFGSAEPVEDFERVVKCLAARDEAGAGQAMSALPPVLQPLVWSATKMSGWSREVLRDRLVSLAKDQVALQQQNLAVLATLAAVAPLLGFLGTIVGMIRAFMSIEELEGSVTPSVLAGGIWQALVTTGAGLAVGIVILVIHNVLAARVDDQAGRMGRSADMLLDATEGA